MTLRRRTPRRRALLSRKPSCRHVQRAPKRSPNAHRLGRPARTTRRHLDRPLPRGRSWGRSDVAVGLLPPAGIGRPRGRSLPRVALCRHALHPARCAYVLLDASAGPKKCTLDLGEGPPPVGARVQCRVSAGRRKQLSDAAQGARSETRGAWARSGAIAARAEARLEREIAAASDGTRRARRQPDEQAPACARSAPGLVLYLWRSSRVGTAVLGAPDPH
jgi:hypothetical protein